MSRALPAKPSLESLRKQAKQIQRTMTGGKLAEAQHALAREYGFANWARLKSYVVTLGLPPAEALTAGTINAAYSLNRGDEIGSLDTGKFADFVVHDAEDYRELPYFFGDHQAAMVFAKGVRVI